jgi:prepilin-type N-terminal cleavage/methylation domain-containing protein
MTRRGFTLIEMLCVIFLVTIMGMAFGHLLRETLEVERLQSAGFDKLLHINALADQFRADVANAESAPDQWQLHQADGRTLILHIPGEGYVLYVHDLDELQRKTFEPGRELLRTLPAVANVMVEFVRDVQYPNLVRMRLQPLRQGIPVAGQTLEIAAALGGDRR